MKAYLKELQAHLLGSVTDNKSARDYFSTDGGIFKITPEAVVYPRNTADVRKTVRYAGLRAAAGKPMSVTSRGAGTDQGGAAIGAGLQLVFPAHMNRLLRLDKNTVTVQPGINYAALQQTLKTHGRYLPPAPASADFCTLGGAVANNAGGELSLKYGQTRDYIDSLKVVLADGSLIETRRISARELNRKKGQADFEGDLYRQLDGLILDNTDVINRRSRTTTKNSSGYALNRVRGKDGSFDLSQIFCGSQGTLGVITEITLKTAKWNPNTTLVVGFFDSLDQAGHAVNALAKLKPAALEFVDHFLLNFVHENRPEELGELVPTDPLPQFVLLCEFDDARRYTQTAKARRAQKILKANGATCRVATDPIEQSALWKIRHSAAAVIWMEGGTKKALPFIEDAAVPPTKLVPFIKHIYKLFKKYDLEVALWGHAGDGNIHLQPFLDLTKKRDQDKIFALSNDFFKAVAALGGTSSGEHGDGLARAPYLRTIFGSDMYRLFLDCKHIFDPAGILNPGKKVDVTEDDLRPILRDEYSMKHLYDHLPRG
jgi:FAD/FMN-containing dehydrogenase